MKLIPILLVILIVVSIPSTYVAAQLQVGNPSENLKRGVFLFSEEPVLFSNASFNDSVLLNYWDLAGLNAPPTADWDMGSFSFDFDGGVQLGNIAGMTRIQPSFPVGNDIFIGFTNGYLFDTSALRSVILGDLQILDFSTGGYVKNDGDGLLSGGNNIMADFNNTNIAYLNNSQTFTVNQEFNGTLTANGEFEGSRHTITFTGKKTSVDTYLLYSGVQCSATVCFEAKQDGSLRGMASIQSGAVGGGGADLDVRIDGVNQGDGISLTGAWSSLYENYERGVYNFSAGSEIQLYFDCTFGCNSIIIGGDVEIQYDG